MSRTFEEFDTPSFCVALASPHLLSFALYVQH